MKVEGWLFAAGFFFFALAGGRLRLLVRGAGRHGRAGLHRRAGLPGRLLPALHRPAHRPRGPRTRSTPRSPTAPVSWASTARTAGGRCRWPFFAAMAFLGIVFGWWLFIIGAVGGGAGGDRAGLRVLPGRARPLRPTGTRSPPGGFRPTPRLADSLSNATARNWTDAGQPVRLVRRLPRQERRRLRGGVCGGSGRPAGRGQRACDAVRACCCAPWRPRLPLALVGGCTSSGSPSAPAAQAADDDGVAAVSRATHRPPARQRLGGRPGGPAGRRSPPATARCPRSR